MMKKHSWAGYLFAGLAAMAIPALPVNAGEVITTVVNWYSPVGQFNGNQLWMHNGGYSYEGRVKRGQNYPTTWQRLAMPATAPAIGSPEYLKLTYEGAKAELLDMKAAGIDVALYDCLPMPDYDPAKPLTYANSPISHYLSFFEWLRAASECGMKVGVFLDIRNRSGDYPKGRDLNVQEWVKVISGVLDNLPKDKTAEALWRVNGVPALIHFGTDSVCKAPPEKGDPAPDGGWRKVISELRKQGKKFYFVADMRTHIPEKAEWKHVADALYTFSPGGPDTYLADSGAEMKAFFAPMGIPYYFSTSPGYYWPKVAYVEPGFKRIHSAYAKAVAERAEKVHVLTWNDIGEDTDILPTANKGRCLLTVYAYYNAWYKNGTPPPLTEEHLILCYPLSVSPEKITPTQTWGNGRWKERGYAPRVFYWANLKTARKVEIAGVGTVELPAGLSMGEFAGLAGKCDALKVTVDGAVKELPGIVEKPKEDFRFRYVDLYVKERKAL